MASIAPVPQSREGDYELGRHLSTSLKHENGHICGVDSPAHNYEHQQTCEFDQLEDERCNSDMVVQMSPPQSSQSSTQLDSDYAAEGPSSERSDFTAETYHTSSAETGTAISIDSSGDSFSMLHPAWKVASESSIRTFEPGEEETKTTPQIAWRRIAKIARDRDEAKIKDCKEGIDTLLVFAGLFSAVLTAFVVESYRLLQDPTDVSVQLLQRISQQLGELTTSNASTAASISVSSSPFTASSSAVRVNVLWFASLVCSLVTASLGILIKQWLHQYMSHDSLSPDGQLRIRHLRREGMVRWRVFEIIAMLPTMLQCALALFLLGLSEFLRTLHPVVGGIISGLILICALFFALAAIAPAFSSQCPYKTPVLNGLLRRLRLTFFVAGDCILYWRLHLVSGLRRFCVLHTTIGIRNLLQYLSNLLQSSLNWIASRIRLCTSRWALFVSRSRDRLACWYELEVLGDGQVRVRHDNLPIEESSIRSMRTANVRTLIGLDAEFPDDEFLDLATRCLSASEIGMAEVLDCVSHMISHRSGRKPALSLKELPPHCKDKCSKLLYGTIMDAMNRSLKCHDNWNFRWSRIEGDALLFLLKYRQWSLRHEVDLKMVIGRALQVGSEGAAWVLYGVDRNIDLLRLSYTGYLPSVIQAAHHLILWGHPDQYGGCRVSPGINTNAVCEGCLWHDALGMQIHRSKHTNAMELCDGSQICLVLRRLELLYRLTSLLHIVLFLVTRMPVEELRNHAMEVLDLQHAFANRVRFLAPECLWTRRVDLVLTGGTAQTFLEHISRHLEPTLYHLVERMEKRCPEILCRELLELVQELHGKANSE
ncbi:unnamed protein product [Somion occarium]|uniref:DUF6535 domain-containing protein n=1 Tax=Somion occarium TaxID=3059160 RepID=A0ABP1DHS8_9APHY